MSKKVIVSADDLGMSKGINDAISVAFEEGVLTSASIMANMAEYEDAVTNTIARNREMGIGIHVCLTEGMSILHRKEIPLLVNDDGVFNNGFIEVFIKSKSDRFMSQVHAEMKAQFERVRCDGIEIDHVNGHHHIHMIPRVFDCVRELGEANGCKGVRLSNERFGGRWREMGLKYVVRPLMNGNIVKKIMLSVLAMSIRKRLKGMRCPDYCYGVLDSGGMDERTLRYILNSVKPGVTEIITHPGLLGEGISEEKGSRKGSWSQCRRRRRELEGLLSDAVGHGVERNDIRLIRFAEM